MDTEVPKLADGFSEPLHSMIRETPACSLVALPAMDRPPHAVHGNGIVYIGDAWHPMSPFSGLIFRCHLRDAVKTASLHRCTASYGCSELDSSCRQVMAMALSTIWGCPALNIVLLRLCYILCGCCFIGPCHLIYLG